MTETTGSSNLVTDIAWTTGVLTKSIGRFSLTPSLFTARQIAW